MKGIRTQAERRKKRDWRAARAARGLEGFEWGGGHYDEKTNRNKNSSNDEKHH